MGQSHAQHVLVAVVAAALRCCSSNHEFRYGMPGLKMCAHGMATKACTRAGDEQGVDSPPVYLTSTLFVSVRGT